MQEPFLHRIHDQSFWLSPLRAIYWEEQQALIASDLHFGKTGHFRKAGIAVPQGVYQQDLQNLSALMKQFQPRQFIAVGDLFHSRANLELELFGRWREDLSSVDFQLVRGNHDILEDSWYQKAGIRLWENQLVIDDICFTHEPCVTPHRFTFCGHIHPGITLQGAGKQSLRLPCFYFAPDHSILPAFSRFTGTVSIRPQKTDAVFAVVENSIIPLQ